MAGWHAAMAIGCLALDARPANAEASHAPAAVAVCTPCHGADGAGGDVEIPNLAGQKSIYLRQQLEAFRTGTRKHPEMKFMARELSEREIDQLVVYYSTLVPR
jgi:cytochrome c553